MSKKPGGIDWVHAAPRWPRWLAKPHDVTAAFEDALCAYTGAPFAVTTTSCTQAILMALAWHVAAGCPEHEGRRVHNGFVYMPQRSYVGVPAAIRSATLVPRFTEEDWQGEYQIEPTPVWDSARRFTGGMYRAGAMQCVSFHASKILADTQGGAILHDNPDADAWLRRARFDGRTEGVDPKDDQVQYPSWHAYLSPDVAARLLWKLSALPRRNADLPHSDYPDLSGLEAFK